MIRPALIAGIVTLGVFADVLAAEYQEIGVDELLVRLPLMFETAVVVRGELEAWGDIAALASETGRDLMVDLRQLDEDVRKELNRRCPDDQRCGVTIEGTIRHIRGPEISELGLEAESVEIR